MSVDMSYAALQHRHQLVGKYHLDLYFEGGGPFMEEDSVQESRADLRKELVERYYELKIRMNIAKRNEI